MSHKTLTDAKIKQKDEFYTRLEDIEDELCHYKHHFKDKTVYCNCDDPYESNFTKFFMLKFREYGLKRLICTCYGESQFAARQLTLDGEYAQPLQPHEKRWAYCIDLTSETLGDARNLDDMKALLKRDGVVTMLNNNGDYKNADSIEYLKQADIVVTNPPFSEFIDYVAQLMAYGKKFIIWGNNNSITYKEIFALIMENRIWLGYTANKTCHFRIPDSYAEWDEKYTAKMNDGYKYAAVPAISVFTNLDITKRHEPIELYERYDPKKYPKYDNYDAINVDDVKDIPIDYDGVMGVPITFMSRYDPEQFRIVKFRKGDDDKDLLIDGDSPYFRILIKRRPLVKKYVQTDLFHFIPSQTKLFL